MLGTWKQWVDGMTITFSAASVALAGAAIWIAVDLDKSDSKSAAKTACVTSALHMLDALDELDYGYDVAPYGKSDRLKDWQSATEAVDEVSVVCVSSMNDRERSDLTSLRRKFDDADTASSSGQWSSQTPDSLRDWTKKFIGALAK